MEKLLTHVGHFGDHDHTSVASLRRCPTSNGIGAPLHRNTQHVRDAEKRAVGESIMKLASTMMLTEDQKVSALGLISTYDLQPDHETKQYARAFVVMSNLLHQLANGCEIEYGLLEDDPPAFILQRGEIPIFQSLEREVMYAEERTVSTGRSYSGIGIPVGHGIRIHAGGSNVERVSGLVELDIGRALITNQHFYFGGPKRTVKIALDKVVRYQPYLDGVGICETKGAPKLFIWGGARVDLGWYVGTMLAILTQRLTD